MDVGMMMVFASYGWEMTAPTRACGMRRSGWPGLPPIWGSIACGRRSITSTTTRLCPTIFS